MAIYDIYLGTFYVFYLDKENLYIKKKIYIYMYIQYIHIRPNDILQTMLILKDMETNII